MSDTKTFDRETAHPRVGRGRAALLGAALMAAMCAPLHAATLWVTPEPSALSVPGQASFEVALPADLSDFVKAEVVLVSSAAASITYDAYLLQSEVFVSGAATLFANRIRELDVSALIPAMAVLLPGEDTMRVVFDSSGGPSQVLALRLEYREAQVEAAGVTAGEVEALTSAGPLVTDPAFSSDGDGFFATNVQIDGGLQVEGPITFTQDGPASGLDADTLDGNEAADFAATGHDHDTSYFTEAELSTSGAGGAVHWDNVTTKPAGFADGTDADSLGGLNCAGGEVAKWDGALGQWVCGVDIDTDTDSDTTYSAGNQLSLAATTFNVEEGSGSGLDSDLLDGIDSTGFALASEGVRGTATNNTAGGDGALDSITSAQNNTAFGFNSLTVNQTGSQNTAIGSLTLSNSGAGDSNTALGYRALEDNTASNNTALGAFSLLENTTGTENTALGRSALVNNTIGSFNTAIGHSSLVNNTEGGRNTATGVNALSTNTEGDSNTAAGDQALRDNTMGSSNTAVGGSALRANTTGNVNTAAGVWALLTNTVGTHNTALGGQALQNVTGTSSNNTALGAGAGEDLETGSNNLYLDNVGVTTESDTIRIGDTQTRAFIAGVSGVSPAGTTETVVIDGSGQLGSAVVGPDMDTLGGLSCSAGQIAKWSGSVWECAADIDTDTDTDTDTLGALSCSSGEVAKWSGSVWACSVDIDTNTDTDTTYSAGNELSLDGTTFNVDEGSGSGLDADLLDGLDSTGFALASQGVLSFATNNTAAGANALDSVSSAIRNTAFGFDALTSNTTGGNNTAIGNQTLIANTTGNNNTATGAFALRDNTGGANTATGTSALTSNTTGQGNTATGREALTFNTTGQENTATGSDTLRSNTTGIRNTATGHNALFSNTTGSGNTAVGEGALTQVVGTSDDNTALGHKSGENLTTGSNNLYLHNPGVAVESDTTRVGDSQTKTFIAGISGVTPGGATETVIIDGSGQLGSVAGVPTHAHDGTDITTGLVDETNIDTDIARDSEIVSTVLAADGAGSGLDADLLDGQEGAAFATETELSTSGSAAVHWDNVTSKPAGFADNTDEDAVGNLSCTNAQVAKFDTGTSAWVCADDIDTDTDTDTTYTAGNELSLDGTTFNVDEGSGSGLDADLLDGLNSTEFATASQGVISAATRNTAAGDNALDSVTTAIDNTAFGFDSLTDNTSGTNNTATGSSALANNTAGNFNTATGSFALNSNTTGSSNTATGYTALQNNTTGSDNTAAGHQALIFNTTGSSNTATGRIALHKNTAGNNNTATGRSALQNNTTASNNTATGFQALRNNTTGSSNTAIGASTLVANTTGFNNIAAGNEALFMNTTGDVNTATGYTALRSNTTGRANTATGSETLKANTTGSSNTATGRFVLFRNTSGDSNTGAGLDSLSNNTTGSNNTATGRDALFRNNTGTGNTAVGHSALFELAGSSNNNTALGKDAGINLTGGSDNLYLDAPGASSESNTIRMGRSSTHTRMFVAGVRGVTTDVADAITVLIDSNGQLGTVSSSRRYKQDIRDMGSTNEALLALRPVVFRYKSEVQAGERPLQFGLIAEEVAEVFPELVVYGKDGKPETVKYHLLNSLLLNEIQRQDSELQNMKKRLARLESALSM